MWELMGSVAEKYGFGALVAIAALGSMAWALREMWRRNKELSEKLTNLPGAYDETLEVLKHVKYAHSGDGDIIQKLNKLLELETALYDAHLGANAKDREGRLKWWGAARIDELMEVQRKKHQDDMRSLRELYETRIAALQEARSLESAEFVVRIDALQEKRVSEAQQVTSLVVDHVSTTRASVEKITTAMEILSSTVSSARRR